MNRFSGNKYVRAEGALASLRSRSVALRNANALIKGEDVTWEPEHAASESVKLEGGPGIMIVKRIRDYLSSCCIGGVSALVKPTLGVSYMVVGDVDRKPVLGENTSGLRGSFDWENMTCTVSTYAGSMTRIEPTADTNHVMRSSAKDRKKIQQATGWDTNVVNALPTDDIHSLDSLFLSANAGHSKLTRLVKGMLLYLDLQRYGEQRFRGDIHNVVEYAVNPVLTSYRASGRSYSYCRNPTSQSYIVMLYLVGLQYPMNVGGLNMRGSVVVPADAKEHYVVLRGVRRSVAFDCTLNAETVWTGILDYAKEMGVADQIEVALVTACSLYDNRYLRVCSLPKVESTLDLIRPAFVESRIDDSYKPMIDRDMGVVLGRCHQMAMLLMAKDIIVAAQASSARGFSYASILRSYISNQEKEVIRMSTAMTPASLIAATPQMKWLSMLSDSDISDISSISILEGLWLCTSKTRSIKWGGIDLLVRARNDLLKNNSYIDLLDSECKKMAITFDRRKLPTGRYSVVSRCLYTHDDKLCDESKFVELDMDLIRRCDYKPRAMPEVRRPRGRRVEPDSPTETASSAASVPIRMPVLEEHEEETPITPKPREPDPIESVTREELSRESSIEDEESSSEDEWDQKGGEAELSRNIPRKDEEKIGSPAVRGTVWQTPLKIPPKDTAVEDILFRDFEANKEQIAGLPEPQSPSRKMKWRDARLELVLEGQISPVLDVEKAAREGEKFVGQADMEWPPSVINKIVGSRAWEEVVRVRFGEEPIFGDKKSVYYGHILGHGIGRMLDIESLDARFTNSTINLDPKIAIRHLSRFNGSPREYTPRDSMTSTRKTPADGLLADAMWAIPQVKRGLSSTAVKSLQNVFVSTPKERHGSK